MAFLSPSDTIWDAVRRGDLEAVCAFVQRDALPNREDCFNRQSLLTVACEAGHIEVVRFLLEVGARKDRFSDRAPEAFAAMRYGRLDVLKLLCDFGVHPYDQEFSKHGNTLIGEAFDDRNIEVVRLLLAYDVSLEDSLPEHLEVQMTEQELQDGCSGHSDFPPALELAARAGDVELAQFYVEVGGVPEGDTADHYLERAQRNSELKPQESAPESEEKHSPEVEWLRRENTNEDPAPKDEVFASDTYQTISGCVMMALFALMAFGIFRIIQQFIAVRGWIELLLWIVLPFFLILLIAKFGRNPPPP